MLIAHTILVTAVLVNLSDASPALIEAVKAEVAVLFGEIDVRVEWIDDHSNGTTPEVFRIVVQTAFFGPPRAFDDGVMGSVTSGPIRTPVARVFFGAVQRLAERRNVPVAGLFSRAIAHEIGHLLQQVKGHAGGGLMRSHWGLKEFQAIANGGLRFTAADKLLFADSAAIAVASR